MLDLRQHYQRLHSEEHGAHNNFRKPNRFALVYPSTYELGMSSLGVQVIYSILNSRSDTACERVFVPESKYIRKLVAQQKPLFSFETQTALNQFDVIGFSVSFESDYVNIPHTLQLANIPPLAEERTEWDPLVIAGGINISYNPEPIADFVDVFVIGEAEYIIHQLMAHFNEWKQSRAPKQELLETLATVPGLYVPSFYDVTYHDDGTIDTVSPKPGVPPPRSH